MLHFLICVFNFECKLNCLVKSESSKVMIKFKKQYVVAALKKKEVVIVNYIFDKVVIVHCKNKNIIFLITSEKSKFSN